MLTTRQREGKDQREQNGTFCADNGLQHESVLELSWKEYPTAAMAACLTAASTLWWPDESIGKASNYLRYAELPCHIAHEPLLILVPRKRPALSKG